MFKYMSIEVPNENNISEYYEALTKYYVYKKKYDEKILNIKKTIGKLKLNKEDKINLYLKKKSAMTCLKCKKVGGMIFEDNNRVLKATCGSAQPCDLNIEIHKNRSVYLPDKLDELINLANKHKKNIVKIKLNMLFELEDEDVSIKNFNDIKVELTTLMEDIKNIKLYMSDINKIPINELEQNTKITKEQYKKNTLTELTKYANQYNSMMNKYDEKSMEDKMVILEEAMTLYSSKIHPIFEELHKSVYDIYQMEVDDDGQRVEKYRLFKKMNSIDKLTKNDEYRVVS